MTLNSPLAVKMKNISLNIFIINLTIALILVVAFEFNVLNNMTWFKPLAAVLGIICSLSIITTPLAIISGIINIKEKNNLKRNVIATLLNSIYLIALILAVKKLWPALMGI